MPFLRALTPFLFLAVLLLFFSFGFVLLFYIILASFAVSLVLYVSQMIKQRFFTKNQKKNKTKPKSGRVIDSDEWHHL